MRNVRPPDLEHVVGEYAGSPTAIAASSEVRVLVRRGVVLLGP